MAWLPCRGRRLIAGNGSLAVEVGFELPYPASGPVRMGADTSVPALLKGEMSA